MNDFSRTIATTTKACTTLIASLMVTSCCYFNYYDSESVIEAEPGKPEFERKLSKRLYGYEYKEPISYTSYRKIHARRHAPKPNDLYNAEYIDTKTTEKIQQRISDADDLFKILLQEGMQCDNKSCTRHYCTWITLFSSDGYIKRSTPEYCLNMIITPSKCEEKLSTCVIIKNFSEDYVRIK